MFSMLLTEDCIIEILNYFNGIKLSTLKEINSTFNDLINAYFISKPLINYTHVFIDYRIKSDNTLYWKTSLWKNSLGIQNQFQIKIEALKNQRLRSNKISITITNDATSNLDIIELDYINGIEKIKHLWENSQVKFFITGNNI